MNGLSSWMEKYILPVAAKIGAQKHLVALRDAFIGTLPATMAGSMQLFVIYRNSLTVPMLTV